MEKEGGPPQEKVVSCVTSNNDVDSQVPLGKRIPGRARREE